MIGDKKLDVPVLSLSDFIVPKGRGFVKTKKSIGRIFQWLIQQRLAEQIQVVSYS